MMSTGHVFKDIIAEACPDASPREREVIFHESVKFFIYGREVTASKAQAVWRQMLREKVENGTQTPQPRRSYGPARGSSTRRR